MTITPMDHGFVVATDTLTVRASNATEVALAVMHVYGAGAQTLDDNAACPFCRRVSDASHGYNWRAKVTA